MLLKAHLFDLFDGIGNFFKAIADILAWLIIIAIVGLGVFIIHSLVYRMPKEIKKKKQQNEEKRRKDDREKAFQIHEPKRRQYYWDHLSEIYDNQATNSLISARKALNSLVYYDEKNYFRIKNGYIYNSKYNNPEERRFRLEMWSKALHELRETLHNPVWYDLFMDGSKSKTNMPLYKDLDIKYIDHILKMRKQNNGY